MKRLPQSELPLSHWKQLTGEEVHQFIEQGYVVVHKVFSRELAAQTIPLVWAELDIDPRDSSTWASPLVMLKKVLENPPFPQIHTERYLGAVDDLCGQGRWHATMGVGHWPILLPGFAKPPWCPPKTGWHVDIALDHPRVDSPELGLVNVEFFTDITPGGGGTAVRVGSHCRVARILEEAQRDGRMNQDELHLLTLSDTDHLPVVGVIAQAGDVLMMHPFMVHAASSNTSDRARVAAVKLIRLIEPMNLMRPDSGAYSPVERAIVEALARTDDGSTDESDES